MRHAIQCSLSGRWCNPGPPAPPSFRLNHLSTNHSSSPLFSSDFRTLLLDWIDRDIRAEAERFLEGAEANQYGEFLIALCQEFADETKQLHSRQLAGLHIKNMISSRESAVTETKVARWAACEPTVQDQARQAFLTALASPHPNVSHTSAQVLAAYGAVDIPASRFPQLIPTLVEGIANVNTPEQMRKSALECIGYMAENLTSDQVDPKQVDQILTALIGGMQTTNSNTVRQAATEALKHTVDLASANFDRQGERDMIMASIKTSATSCDDAAVRKEAYDCLICISELYYTLLSNYIMDVFQYTTAAIKTDEDEVGKKTLSLATSL